MLFDNIMKFNFPLILVFFFIHTVSWGQIITDRPDQTEHTDQTRRPYRSDRQISQTDTHTQTSERVKDTH